MTEDQKNKDFVQLYRSHIDDITTLAMTNGTAFELFMLLIKHMDGSNALCVSNKVLQEILGKSKQTICNAVKYLRENGWICVLKSGTTNVYVVNPEVSWTSYANEKSYCRFNGSFLLSSSENAEYLKNPKATTHYKTIDPGFIEAVKQNKENFIANADSYKNSKL